MGLQTFAILVLLAVGANAQGDLPSIITQSVANKATEVDCLLGKPSCPSPPPPPTALSPPPSPSPPPPSPPPPTPVPTAVAPVPAPTSIPVTLGNAAAYLTLTNPGTPYTPAQEQALAALLAAAIGGGTTGSTTAAGRKLLAVENLTVYFTGIARCTSALTTLHQYVQSGTFETQAALQSIVITEATLESFACSGAGSAAYVAPAPAVSPIAGRR